MTELGVCYYPEHWPEADWEKDAARMVETGISWVRIGEFAWSRLEPQPGQLAFEWLDRAIDTLGAAGLKVVLGTPSATPPRWMLEKYPDMLAHDADGRPRKFGSRRHYCFSHAGYRDEAARMAWIMGRRYGAHDAIAAWQIDNEYDCHDTALSFSPVAAAAFRVWLTERYDSIAALNADWGTVFWSMEYQSFDEIDPPNLTVTVPHPAHVLAYRRFTSDQVVAFNSAQAAELRGLTDKPLIHNYMGRVLGFDHFDVGADLDIASWDSYPIGFLSDRLDMPPDHKAAFLRQGDPDMQAFHHDLYRSVGNGRWWVMEQQPGPVNWAPYNPVPLPGMVSLWAVEAFAHGAEVVSYFRWRQVPFGQEQNHAGLLQPDGTPAPGLAEVRQVADVMGKLPMQTTAQAPVALIFDYPSDWAWDTLRHGAGFDYFELVFSAYRALRRAGLSVDILPASTREFSGYALVLAPGLAVLEPDLTASIHAAGALAIYGPRSGAITDVFSIPETGRPGIAGLDLRVELIESLPLGDPAGEVAGGGHVLHWLDHVSGTAEVLIRLRAGLPVLAGQNRRWYLAGCPDDVLWDRVIAEATELAALPVRPVSGGVRVRRMGELDVLVNYGTDSATFEGHDIPACGAVVLKDSLVLERLG